MSLTKLLDDLNIIQSLDNEPNDIGGLTAEELKAKFDEAVNLIKTFVNSILTTEIDEQKATKAEMQGIVLGQIPDGTLTDNKLSNDGGQYKDVNGRHSSYASSMDSEGIYTIVEYKRTDGTLQMKSTLSGGTSPQYTTDTWEFYDLDGTTLLDTVTWTIAYDSYGNPVSKVVG